MNKVVAKMGASIQCITESEDFLAVCTNKAVIETAFNCYLQQEGPIDDQPLNEYVIFYFCIAWLLEHVLSVELIVYFTFNNVISSS